MANTMLNQFVHLKQPACDYLSQAYEFSHQLTDLIEALKELLSLIQEYTRSSHTLFKNWGKFGRFTYTFAKFKELNTFDKPLKILKLLMVLRSIQKL